VSREARQNLTALAIAALVLILGAIAFSRPGVVLSISDETLADSVARNAGSGFGAVVPPRCRPRGEGWRCNVSVEIGGSSSTRRYQVDLAWDGCWTGSRPERKRGRENVSGSEREGGKRTGSESEEDDTLSGCVSLIDF
jgi:hypothetical protein